MKAFFIALCISMFITGCMTTAGVNKPKARCESIEIVHLNVTAEDIEHLQKLIKSLCSGAPRIIQRYTDPEGAIRAIWVLKDPPTMIIRGRREYLCEKDVMSLLTKEKGVTKTWIIED